MPRAPAAAAKGLTHDTVTVIGPPGPVRGGPRRPRVTPGAPGPEGPAAAQCRRGCGWEPPGPGESPMTYRTQLLKDGLGNRDQRAVLPVCPGPGSTPARPTQYYWAAGDRGPAATVRRPGALRAAQLYGRPIR
eukprot:56032-Hanusia_phi.AAC.1